MNKADTLQRPDSLSRLSKNIIYNLAGQGLLLILGFIAVKYVFTRLGKDALGIIYFTATLGAVLCAVLELGICSTTTREVAAHLHDDPGYIRDLIRTATLYYWGAYVSLAVGLYLAAPFLVEKWVNLETMNTASASRMLQILGIGTLSVLPRSFYGSLLRGLQRMEFNNLIDVGTTGLQQFGIIVILALGGDLFDVIHWFAASFALGILGYLAVSAHFFSFRALVPGYAPAVIRRNVAYSSQMMFNSLLAMVHMQADKLIVSKMLPIGTFGLYAFAFGVICKAALVPGTIFQAAFPSFSALFKAGDRTGLLAQYRRLQDLSCFGSVPALAALPLAALPLFTYLLNAEAARILLLPTALLCVGFYFNGTWYVAYVFSIAAGKARITVRSNFYALFVVLPVTALLIFLFGLTGAALSWVFYQLFYYVYAVPKICSQCLGISAWEWYRHVLKIFALAGLTYGGAWAILRALSFDSLLSVALAYAGASIVFLIGAYIMMGDELRETFLRYLQAVRIRIAEVL
jgi:O-antigen/teichoic acid export membrane protein